MLILKIKCLRLENIYKYNTHNNSSDWLKALRKKRIGQTWISGKCGVNMHFSPWGT